MSAATAGAVGVPTRSAVAAPSAAAVGAHYDALDGWYRRLWGEHVHHGLWERGDETPAEATRALAERVVALARVGPDDRVLDVGCGYGGTARLLAREHGAQVLGVTVSRAQHAYAIAATNGAGPQYLLGDWLRLEVAPARFDAVVAVESLAHMADRPAALARMARALKPGGRLVVCDWLAAARARGGWRERALLAPVCLHGRMPPLATAPEHAAALRAAGLELESFEDRSRQVARTWPLVAARTARVVLTDPAARAFLAGHASERRFALTLPRLAAAYATRALVYGVFVARRP